MKFTEHLKGIDVQEFFKKFEEHANYSENKLTSEIVHYCQKYHLFSFLMMNSIGNDVDEDAPVTGAILALKVLIDLAEKEEKEQELNGDF